MLKRSLLLIALVLLLAGCGPAEPVTQTRAADGMVMVYVPEGDFLMGSAGSDADASDDEKPQHSVYLDGYWIDRTEVSNAQFAAFLNDRGNQEEGGVTWLELDSEYSLIEQAGGSFRPKSGYADHPVIGVSWYGASAYCAWAGGALPTEAQWEKAARGTDGRIYPWGNSFDGTRLNYCDASCSKDWRDSNYDDGYAYIAPVGSYLRGESPYGALDMAGNVWEWAADWYDRGYYAQSPGRNPTGPAGGKYRVLRGGSWGSSNLAILRAADRVYDYPDGRYDYFGFRCVVAQGR